MDKPAASPGEKMRIWSTRSMLSDVGPNQNRLMSAGYCSSQPMSGSRSTAPAGYCRLIVCASVGSYLSQGKYCTEVIGLALADVVLCGIAYGAVVKICA